MGNAIAGLETRSPSCSQCNGLVIGGKDSQDELQIASRPSVHTNDRSDNNCCNVDRHLLRVRTNAASAKVEKPRSVLSAQLPVGNDAINGRSRSKRTHIADEAIDGSEPEEDAPIRCLTRSGNVRVSSGFCRSLVCEPNPVSVRRFSPRVPVWHGIPAKDFVAEIVQNPRAGGRFRQQYGVRKELRLMKRNSDRQ
jgi:hypothetical protein